MSLLNFSKNSEHTVLILDIGNGSVGAALTVLLKGEKPKVLFSIRELIIFEEKPEAEKLKRTLLEKLDHVVSSVMAKGFKDSYFKNHSKKLHKVFCILSSPWYDSKGKTIILSQEKKFVITEKLLNDVLAKELEIFENERKNITENSSGKTCMIEDLFMEMKINGYALKNTVGQKTNNFEASIYMSEAEEDFTAKILNIISKHTHVTDKDIIFHTFPLAVFSAIKDLFPGLAEYMHFDIAGEITDIAWISGGMIKKMVSFPSGKNLITRRIAKNLSVPNEVARSFFRLHMDRRADKNVEEKIVKAIYEAENEWNVYLNDALVSISSYPSQADQPTNLGLGMVELAESGLALPQKVFVTTYPQNYEIFNSFLKMEKSDDTAKWRKGLTVTYLEPDLLSNFLIYNSTQQFDAFLAMEALYIRSNE